MTTEQLLTAIKDLDKQYIGENKKSICKDMAVIVEHYLQENPNDIEIGIRFALFLYAPPLTDLLTSINILRKIIEWDSNNAIALIALAYIKHRYYGGIDDDLLSKLAACQTHNNEIQSMLELAKAWYYREKNDNKNCEALLKQSIELCDTYVYNFKELGKLYIYNDKINEGRLFVKQGLYNVRHIYYDGDCYDHISWKLNNTEHFINEYIKGIFLSKYNFKSLVDRACIQVMSVITDNNITQH